MGAFTPRDPDYLPRVRASFARQAFMGHIGAEIVHVAPGEVDVACAARAELTQQHGFFHAGVTSSIADSAAGYAALSLFEPGTGVLTTEFKINFVTPAKGERLIARGRVIRPGRTLTICRADVFALDAEVETLCATALLTMMQLSRLGD
jgi:uncharacterized protein (TIGR00369 family)